MKTSVAILAAAAGLAMAEPKFLNSNFDVVPGEPFTLKFSGCDGGCKIDLLNGPSKNLKVVQTLIPKTSGDEETITLSKNFNTDKYAFRIEDSEGAVNYSEQFDFEGQEPAPTTSEEETSTAAETTSSVEETSTSAEETTTLVTITTDTETLTTPEPSTTETETETESSTTTSGDASETTNSDSDNSPDAAVRLGSSHVTLAAAVVALAGYFL